MQIETASAKALRSRAEAAHYLDVSTSRIDTLIRSGQLAALREGASVKIATQELDRYIADLPAWEPGEFGSKGKSPSA